MDKERIQDSILHRLRTAVAPFVFRSERLPETQSGYDVALKAPAVYIVYNGSTGDPPNSTRIVSQKRRLKFTVEMHGRLLYGDKGGLHALSDAVEKCLVGFKPLGCQRMYLVKDELSQVEDGAVWVMVLQLECETLLVQVDDPDTVVVPALLELQQKNEQ